MLTPASQKRITKRIWQKQQKEREQLEDLGLICRKLKKPERNWMRRCELDSYGYGGGTMLGSYRHRNKIQVPFLAYCRVFSLNLYPMQCNLIPLTYFFQNTYVQSWFTELYFVMTQIIFGRSFYILCWSPTCHISKADFVGGRDVKCANCSSIPICFINFFPSES